MPASASSASGRRAMPRRPHPPPPTLLESAIPKWIEQAPLLGLIAVLGIIALALLARRRDADDTGFDDQVLAAALLAEVSAIRDAAGTV